MDIGLLGAFLGGVLTLLSPCSAMLLPAFFSYAFAAPRELLTRTGVFYLGLVTTLVPLGVLAGSLGAIVNEHRFTLVTGASVVVIVLGALMLLNVPVPFLRRGTNAGGTSMTAVYALGTVYGLAGVCAGPLLGAVLTVAAVSGTPLAGGIIVLAFAGGMCLPLLVLAALWSRFPVVRGLVRPREVKVGRWSNTLTGLVGGVLTVGVGILLLATAGTTDLAGILGAGAQAELEGNVLGWAGRIPDSLVVSVAVLIAISGALIVRTRHRRADKESPVSRETPPRLPVGTRPGVLILVILVLLAVAMWRASVDSGGGLAAQQGQVVSRQPDYSHAERRDSADPFALGPVDAPVGLVVFSDYQCPFCAQWSHETLPLMIARAEAGDLRIEWRDVNVYGSDSERASLAAFAAAAQGRFWEYHDALFADGRTRRAGGLSEEGLVALAGELGLARAQFATDMSSPAAAQEIARNKQLAIDHGAVSTPVFLLGGKPLVGAQPPEVLLEEYEAALDANGG